MSEVEFSNRYNIIETNLTPLVKETIYQLQPAKAGGLNNACKADLTLKSPNTHLF